MDPCSRRRFLAGAAVLAAGAALPTGPLPAAANAAMATRLRIDRRFIEVAGRSAEVFGLVQPDGSHGLYAQAGGRFHVELDNASGEPALIHWHGLTPPAAQDGVPGLSQAPLATGETFTYDFPLARPGTNWMHSHLGLQEQRMMAAPLIVHDPAEAGLDEQEIVVMLHDFTFRDPDEILAALRGGGMSMDSGDMGDMPGMDHASMGHGTATPGLDGMPAGGMVMDLNDVEFDAFLANDRTLADPEVVAVERGGRVRLRIINGAAATSFWLDLGALSGTLVAVDGMSVQPVEGHRFELAIAQRLDIRLRLPASGGAFPVLARREGDSAQTGIVLATAGASVNRVPDRADLAQPAVGLALEARLAAAAPLPTRPVDRRHVVALTGGMMTYDWGIDGRTYDARTGVPVRRGERVELVFANRTGMAHPMHLHGHHFQVVGIGERSIAGALRDTVLVPPAGSVTVAFDADNPGSWALHCHNLYHMAAGMMTALVYET